MNFKSLANQENPHCNFGVASLRVFDNGVRRYCGLYFGARESRVTQDRQFILIRLYVRFYAVEALLKEKANEF